MQIVCPACAAAYEVPTTLLRPGQAVRCARCAGEWVPPSIPTDDPSETDPAPAPASNPALGIIQPSRRPPVAPSAPPSHRIAPRIGWAASVVILLLLGWGAYAERATIMQIWPPSIRLYAVLGLTGGN
jgi:predicted Zn finger-like uncharacterized protein